jgi:hypothetical protein
MAGCLTLMLVIILALTGHWWILCILLMLAILCSRNKLWGCTERPGYIAQIIDRLLRKEFANAETVMLTLSVMRTSVFSESGRVGNFPLRKFTGEYDLSGNQILTAGRITLDSVRRFKGQQAPTVTLVDVEADPARPYSDSASSTPA